MMNPHRLMLRFPGLRTTRWPKPSTLRLGSEPETAQFPFSANEDHVRARRKGYRVPAPTITRRCARRSRSASVIQTEPPIGRLFRFDLAMISINCCPLKTTIRLERSAPLGGGTGNRGRTCRLQGDPLAVRH